MMQKSSVGVLTINASRLAKQELIVPIWHKSRGMQTQPTSELIVPSS